jgi:Na+/H+ antiporter NhaC
MFEDNLSNTSDTTVASVMSQQTDLKEKLKINVKIVAIVLIITVVVLFLIYNTSSQIIAVNCSLLLITPYIF